MTNQAGGDLPTSGTAERRGRELAELALDRLSRLHGVRSALAETLTQQQIASIVLNAAVSAVKAHGGSVLLFAGNDEPITVLAAVGEARPVVPATITEPLFEPGRAAVPLMVDGRGIGLLSIHFEKERVLDRDERDLLAAFANQCAQGLDRARLHLLALTAEADLRRSRDQLAAILSGIAEGVTVQDAQGRLVYANDVAAQLSGFPSAEELVNAPAAEILARYALFDEQGQPLPFDRLPGRKLLRGERAAEIVVCFRDQLTGESRWSILDASAVTDDQGRVQLVVNIFRDVTERKRHADASDFLARASNVLSSSLDAEVSLGHLAQLAVPTLADWCIVDLVTAEGSIERLVVAHADPSLVEQADTFRHQEPAELAGGALGRVLRSRGAELSNTDGSWIVVAMRARRHTLGAISLGLVESGRRYGEYDLELAQDLANRAGLAVDNARLYGEAQEQAEHQAALNAALRATIDERDSAVADLQHALRTRDEFLASASHDLKNPLGSIKAIAQLLQRRVQRAGGPDPDQIYEGLQRVDAIATRAAGQVDELLDLARMQMGRPIELERRSTDLVRLLADVIREQQQMHERHTLRLLTRDSEMVGEVDGNRLSRVLTNLIDNAVKYSPQGGSVDVRLQREAPNWAIIEVEDHGIGIPAADVQRIFERFQRASNVEGRIVGTGIGLASVRYLVETHGGTIEVSSREGEGATFRVRLPLGG